MQTTHTDSKAEPLLWNSKAEATTGGICFQTFLGSKAAFISQTVGVNYMLRYEGSKYRGLQVSHSQVLFVGSLSGLWKGFNVNPVFSCLRHVGSCYPPTWFWLKFCLFLMKVVSAHCWKVLSVLVFQCVCKFVTLFLLSLSASHQAPHCHHACFYDGLRIYL